MIWLTWRQHRAMVTAFLLAFGGLAVLYLIDGVSLHRSFDNAGLAQCVGVINDPGCAGRRVQFLAFSVGWLRYVGPLLTLASGALGVFFGAPLIASELERGTHQWAWTQRISRTRWLAVKYALLTAVLIGLSVGLATAYTWWNEPIAALTGPFTRFGSFDNSPLLFPAYSVFGFAAGVAASTFIRRTVAAMGATMIVFLVARLGIVYALRPRFMTPVSATSDANAVGLPLGFDPRDWDWRSRWVDSHGHTVSEAAINHLVNPATSPAAAGTDEATVLQQHGIHYVDTIQPFHRAPTFQLIEFAIYAALIAGFAALAFWRIRRRAM